MVVLKAPPAKQGVPLVLPKQTARFGNSFGLQTSLVFIASFCNTLKEYGVCDDEEAPDAFRQHTRLSQHISFLKDFFRSYKGFADRNIDTIELMLERLYARWNIDDNTDIQSIQTEGFPTLSDLYDQIKEVYQSYVKEGRTSCWI